MFFQIRNKHEILCYCWKPGAAASSLNNDDAAQIMMMHLVIIQEPQQFILKWESYKDKQTLIDNRRRQLSTRWKPHTNNTAKIVGLTLYKGKG